jgi:hypothetical protein
MRRYLLYCQPFQGSHTAVRIKEKIDECLENVEGLHPDCYKVVVHDAAANMKKASSMSTCDETLLCADHGLNLVLEKAEKESEQLFEIISKFDTLASTTHRSSIFLQDLKMACEKKSVNFIRIVTSAPTRWNSRAMMLNSILRLRPALEYLRMSDKSKFSNLIPASEDFDTIEEISSLLDSFRTVSEVLSGDKTSTIQNTIVNLFNLRAKCHNLSRLTSNQDIRAYAESLIKHLQHYFPDCGTSSTLYNKGCFFHPYFRGLLIKKVSEERYKEFVRNLIESHESTKNFRAGLTEQADSTHSNQDPGILDDAALAILDMRTEGMLYNLLT